jgi:hypothetical protein
MQGRVWGWGGGLLVAAVMRVLLRGPQSLHCAVVASGHVLQREGHSTCLYRRRGTL